MKCNYCGREEVLPFKCQYCQGLFCAEHRLPENHACPQIEKAKAPKELAPPFEYKVTYTPTRHRAKFGFSLTEVRHLIISALLVSGVGFSMLGARVFISNLEVVVVLLVAFTFSFLLHEIAHKIVAQRYGLWAEFRLVLSGALLTFISIVIPFPKFIAPGAVMIAGAADKNTIGKTSIAGPLTNIILGTTSFAIAFVTPLPFIVITVLAAFYNAFIAVINLIPVGMLDGLKVYNWNKPVWAMAFISSVALMIAVFALYSPYLGL